MRDPATPRARISRESRLLLLTVLVCAAVLVLMARVRFPSAASTPAEVAVPAPAPLERLAAQASYDALAADVQRVESMIAPNLIVLRVVPRPATGPRALTDALTPGNAPAGIRHVAALRVADDVAIAMIDSGSRIDGIVGETGGGTASVLAVDPVRRIARIRVPSAPVRPLAQVALAALPAPLYVVVVEGTQAGMTVRPVFLGRGDRFASPRWSRPLLPLGGIAVSPGALLFSLSGAFIGAAVLENGAPAIAGSRDVVDTGERLAANPVTLLADPGFAVQPLTAALKAALGVEYGVVVADVDPGSSADGKLEPGDVITAADNWSGDSPDELLLQLASHAPGDTISVTVVRDGATQQVSLVLRAVAAADVRVSLASDRAGARVSAVTGLADGDLQAGDVIVRAGAVRAPSPVQVQRFLTGESASGLLALTILRDGRLRLVAVPAGIKVDARAR